MTILTNKRAAHNYQLTDTFQAGISLLGGEVKSLRAGNATLHGSFVRQRGNEAWLVNAYIAPYQAQPASFNSRRPRKLLLTKRELAALQRAAQNGQHVVPLSVQSQHGLLKLTIAVGKIKRKADKRQALRKREALREQKR